MRIRYVAHSRRICLTAKFVAGEFSLYSPACLLPTVYCLLLFITTPSLSASGGWAATYGGTGNDSASSIHETNDGGYIVAGTTLSFGAGKMDAWVLKLRVDGMVEWQKTYGGLEDDGAFSIRQTTDGGYVVASGTKSFGVRGRDMWVLKLRADGTVEWQKTYGGAGEDGATCIQQTVDGGYIVVGSTWRWGKTRVLKLRADGTVEWQWTYRGNAQHIQQTGDGGYIMAGWISFGGSDEFWVLKLDAEGIVEWQKAYGGEENEKAWCIQQTRDGGYIMAGKTLSFGAFGAEEENMWVLKLGPDGTVEWQKTYGGTLVDEAKCVLQTTDGGYVVGGWTSEILRINEEAFGRIRFGILKLRADGTVEWQKAYERKEFNKLSSIQQTRDGGYIVAGVTRPIPSKDEFDLLVFKLRPDGSVAPSCGFVKEANMLVGDSEARVWNTYVYPGYSDVRPQDSSAIVQDTDASVDLFCTSTDAKP